MSTGRVAPSRRTSIFTPGVESSRTVLLEAAHDLFVILVGHQSHADLGHPARRDHRLLAFAREPADQAVHAEGRPRPLAHQRRELRLAL